MQVSTFIFTFSNKFLFNTNPPAMNVGGLFFTVLYMSIVLLRLKQYSIVPQVFFTCVKFISQIVDILISATPVLA